MWISTVLLNVCELFRPCCMSGCSTGRGAAPVWERSVSVGTEVTRTPCSVHKSIFYSLDSDYSCPVALGGSVCSKSNKIWRWKTKYLLNPSSIGGNVL